MHRAHDYRHLVARWQAVCREAGVRLRGFARAGKHTLHYVATPAAGPAVYVSAGIHGDEPAGAEALIAWVEEDPARLRRHALLLFPCLNPWGLANNTRLDAEGCDLNRSFHLADHPLIRGWREVLAARRFEAALALHEDYDGQGLYLYEIQHRPPGWGERLLQAAQPAMPIEGRARVDRFAAKAGIIRRRPRDARFAVIGYPEAIWLHQHHAVRTFTVETPSEFALAQRVAAHQAVLNETLRAVAGR